MSSIKIDFSKNLGAFKPVNGIDNGPVCFGSLIDSTEYYKQAAFPYCRLHDTNYPHPREVDIPTIFKNFDADPDDPASYSFAATDVYLKEILAAGAKIIYRMGISIEHPKLKYYTDPPKDFGKWAKVCLNIARHYNEGWADGFNMGIEYWEVWNEPDQQAELREMDSMWSGTPEEYFALYAVTSRLFKEKMPYVKIGGYASCGMLSPKLYDYFIRFLQYVRDNKLPLDFYSWHVYTFKLSDIRENARIARENLDRFGFTETESILDEWNYLTNMPNIWGEIMGGGGALKRYKVFSETSGVIGASFTAAALVEMANLPIDIATHYDGHPTNFFCTIFDRYGLPTKQFYAFDAFNRLIGCGEKAELSCDAPGVYALAASGGVKAGILAVNWDGQTDSYRTEIKGLDPDGTYLYELFVLDAYSDLEKIYEKTGKISELPDSIYLHSNSAAFVKYSRL